jgi:ElaB/YqjD/DUF883 family membrane-anchored ribosome-binding protein
MKSITEKQLKKHMHDEYTWEIKRTELMLKATDHQEETLKEIRSELQQKLKNLKAALEQADGKP